MKNWLIQDFIFRWVPTPANFIKARYSHFNFCKRPDPSLTADLYVDNLAGELISELRKFSAVDKKSLIYSLFQRILSDAQKRKRFLELMAENDLSNEKINHFLRSLNLPEAIEEVEVKTMPQVKPEIPARTYVIAAHILLELNHNELHYETLIRDTSAMQEFIITNFRPNNLSKRLSDMKGFNYKTLLKAKGNTSVKGQLKPQFRTIASSPHIFGQKVSAFAEKILQEQLEY